MNKRNQSAPGTKEKARRNTVWMGSVIAALATFVAAILTGCGFLSNTPTRASDVAATPIIDLDNHLVRLVDRYYTCINFANPELDQDYEECWNYLSDEPGEPPSFSTLEDFTAFWKQYNVGYLLNYCPRGGEHFVDAETYFYSSGDIIASMGDRQTFVIEYSFASESDGWKIKSGVAIGQEIRPECEGQPRIRKLTLPY